MTTALSGLRKLAGLSQEELAEKVGVTPRTILNYEKDIKLFRRANYETLKKIANELGVSVDDVFLDDTSVFLKRINDSKFKS